MMLLVVLFTILLSRSPVFGRLDLEPFEDNPIPSSVYCIGTDCSDHQGGTQAVNDAPPTVFFCNGTETSYNPDPADCQSYYICHKGNATHLTCPGGMAYSREVQLCVSERHVKECQMVTCQRNGLIPDTKNCTRFYNCVFGFPHRLTCPSGTRFDPVSRHCSSTVPCITGEKYLLSKHQLKFINDVNRNQQRYVPFSVIRKFDFDINDNVNNY